LGCCGAGHLPETGFLSPDGATTPLRQRVEAGSPWLVTEAGEARKWLKDASPETTAGRRAALHRNRSGTVTVAEKAGRASCSCGTPCVRWRGFSRKPKRPLSLRAPDSPTVSEKRAAWTAQVFRADRAAALSFPRPIPGGSIPKRRSGGVSIPSKRSSAGVFQARDQLLSFRAGRLPVFPGGVIQIAGTMPRLRGFPIAGAARFFPILARWRPGSFPGAAAFVPSAKRRFSAGGFIPAGPASFVSAARSGSIGRPPPQVPDDGSRLSRLDLDLPRGNDHPRRRTTINAGIPGGGPGGGSRPAVPPNAPARTNPRTRRRPSGPGRCRGAGVSDDKPGLRPSSVLSLRNDPPSPRG